MVGRRTWVLFAGLVLGCAGGGGADAGGGGGVDSGPRPPRMDAGGPLECGSGEHMCGGGCIDDLENEPANGCRLGCGEPCPSPPDGEAACADDGTCTFDCPDPFTFVDGECVCEPRTCDDLGAMCGAPDDGCGSPLDCGSCEGGGSCIEGVCACAPDAREPNESRLQVSTADYLRTFDDSDDDEQTWTEFSLQDVDDVDWFRFDVNDGSDGGAPVIEVVLDDIPTGSNYDLSAFWTCDDGTPGEGCDAGMPDSEIGFGCSSNSSGTTSEQVVIDSWCGHTFGGDPGTLYVRVRAATHGGSCEPYSLRVYVH